MGKAERWKEKERGNMNFRYVVCALECLKFLTHPKTQFPESFGCSELDK